MYSTLDVEMHTALQARYETLMAGPSQCYVCPITQELFADPVIAFDGHTYERRAISRHLQILPRRSPMTNEILARADVFPNHQCRSAVADYKESMKQEFAILVPYLLTQDVGQCARLVEKASEFVDFQQQRKWKIALIKQCIKQEASRQQGDVAGKSFSDLADLDLAAAQQLAMELPEDVLQLMYL